MMTDAHTALDSLRTMLTTRRQEIMERMAKGVEKDEDYRVWVGQCKALRDVIGMITDQIKSLSGGSDDDEVKLKRPSEPVKYA